MQGACGKLRAVHPCVTSVFYSSLVFHSIPFCLQVLHLREIGSSFEFQCVSHFTLNGTALARQGNRQSSEHQSSSRSAVPPCCAAASAPRCCLAKCFWKAVGTSLGSTSE